MKNPFARNTPVSGPATAMLAVVPSDTADLPEIAVSLYIETAGTVRFMSVGGQISTVKVPDYHTIICGVRRVYQTGTTAVGIHAYAVP